MPDLRPIYHQELITYGKHILIIKLAGEAFIIYFSFLAA
nr:MAG TPA: hypothetical protein [Caudoviricetes sp.]